MLHSFGLRGHVPAFPLADMSASGKAPTCRSGPHLSLPTTFSYTSPPKVAWPGPAPPPSSSLPPSPSFPASSTNSGGSPSTAKAAAPPGRCGTGRPREATRPSRPNPAFAAWQFLHGGLKTSHERKSQGSIHPGCICRAYTAPCICPANTTCRSITLLVEEI